MPQPARLVERTVHPAAVTAFWFGIQVVWGAILAVALQSRVSEFAPFATIETYARVAAIGASVAMIVQLGSARSATGCGAKGETGGRSSPQGSSLRYRRCGCF